MAIFFGGDYYRLQVVEDAAYILNKDGKFVDSEELHGILIKLADTHIESCRAKLSQQEFLMQQAEAIVNQALEDSEMVWPECHKDIYRSGPCVYFVTSDEREGIKVGRADNLSTRFKALRRQHGKSTSVLAYLRTSDHYRLESAMHHLVAKHRIGGEWFNSEAVWRDIIGKVIPL